MLRKFGRPSLFVAGSVLLASSLLLSETAVAGPLYEVGGQGAGIGCSAASPGVTESETAGLGLDEAVGNVSLGQNNRQWRAEANQTSLSAFGSVYKNAATAGTCTGVRTFSRYEYDDLIFHDTVNDYIDVTLQVRYQGHLEAHVFGPDTAAIARFRNEATLGTVSAGGTTGLFFSDEIFEVAAGRADRDVYEEYDQVLTLTWTDVPTNTALTFTMGILVEAFAGENFGQGGWARGDFTADFANLGSVFSLPVGVNASSESLGLVGNSLIADVPEPATWSLLALGGGLTLLGSRRRRKDAVG